MTQDEIVRELQIIRYSARGPRIGRRTPGVRTVAAWAGISYRTLYRIIDSGECSPGQAEVLGRALAAVTKREVSDPPPAARYSLDISGRLRG